MLEQQLFSLPASANTVGIRNLTIQKPETFENRTFLYPAFEWSIIQKQNKIFASKF